MNNPYIEYYKNQAGNGMTFFEGTRYQRGHGFFGSIFKNILKPLGLYLGKHILSTGSNIGQDLKESAKNRLLETGNQVLTDSIDRARRFAQTGKGRKRRRKRKPVIISSIPKPKTKVIKKKKSKRKIKRKVKRKSTKRSKKQANQFKHLF